MDGSIDLEPIGRRLASAIQHDFHLDVLITRIERTLGDAAERPRDGGGRPDEAYRMALLAERLSRVLIQESWRECA